MESKQQVVRIWHIIVKDFVEEFDDQDGYLEMNLAIVDPNADSNLSIR